MTRQNRPMRIVLGLLVFIFVFSVLSAAAGIWINGRLYEIEKNEVLGRAYAPVQWSTPSFDTLSSEHPYRQPIGEK